MGLHARAEKTDVAVCSAVTALDVRALSMRVGCRRVYCGYEYRGLRVMKAAMAHYCLGNAAALDALVWYLVILFHKILFIPLHGDRIYNFYDPSTTTSV